MASSLAQNFWLAPEQCTYKRQEKPSKFSVADGIFRALTSASILIVHSSYSS